MKPENNEDDEPSAFEIGVATSSMFDSNIYLLNRPTLFYVVVFQIPMHSNVCGLQSNVVSIGHHQDTIASEQQRHVFWFFRCHPKDDEV